jgi:hypothetical protein
MVLCTTEKEIRNQADSVPNIDKIDFSWKGKKRARV